MMILLDLLALGMSLSLFAWLLRKPDFLRAVFVFILSYGVDSVSRYCVHDGMARDLLLICVGPSFLGSILLCMYWMHKRLMVYLRR